MWQDLVISVVQIVFSAALLPSVFSKNKPNCFTSLFTFLGLCAMAFSLYTLCLFYSAIWTTVSALLWFILFLQTSKHEYKYWFKDNGELYKND